MTDMQKVLRAEITRLARKEIKAEVEALKKTSSQQRSTIAELRRQIDALARQVKNLSKGIGAAQAKSAAHVPEGEEADAQPARRFSAGRLAAHRAKLGLSAAAYGKLAGVSGQTIFNWEQGSARPRPAQLQALVQVRSLTKTEVESQLQ